MFVQLVVAAGNRAGQVIHVLGEKFIIGRAEDCHLRPRSELISRYHCAILVGEGVVVRDLGSKNGVRLNGEKVSAEHKLETGDKLVVGPLEFFVNIVADDRMAIKDRREAGTNRDEAEDNSDETGSTFNSTLLLSHLETLNRETRSETRQPEQNVNDLVKKFL